MQVHTGQPGWQQIVAMLVVLAIVLAIRGRRLMRVRPLKLDRLWVVPAIYSLVVAWLFYRMPPSPVGWLLALAALAVGGAIGWQRGRTTRLHFDPATQTLMQQGSFWAVAIIAVLIAVKMMAQVAGPALHFDVGLVVDALAALSLGVFAVQRVEMYQRATRLIAAARG